MGKPLLVSPSGESLVPDPDQEVVEFNDKGMMVMSHFHILAQRYNWSIRCEKCGQPIQGYNSGNEAKYMSLRCECREYRADITSIRGRI